MTSKLKILHLITGLGTGGAEQLLKSLIASSDPQAFEHSVVCLSGPGETGTQLEALGVPVTYLRLRSIPSLITGFFRFNALLSRYRPDVIHTWMYHSDLLGGIAGKLRGAPVLWSIHHAHPRLNKRPTRLIAWLCAVTSRWIPRKILACSSHAAATHAGFGYAAHKLHVINNGVDTRKFTPDPANARETRVALGIPDMRQIVGHIARWDPIKDHLSVIKAADRVRKRFPDAMFVMVGKNIDSSNPTLRKAIDAHGLQDAVILLGEQTDIPRIVATFDLSVSSSIDESFSLVTAEAMASEVPCIGTDVGITASLIGDTGIVVPPASPERLAEAIETMLSKPESERRALGAKARERIQTLFSLERMVRDYQVLYRELRTPPSPPT